MKLRWLGMGLAAPVRGQKRPSISLQMSMTKAKEPLGHSHRHTYAWRVMDLKNPFTITSRAVWAMPQHH